MESASLEAPVLVRPEAVEQEQRRNPVKRHLGRIAATGAAIAVFAAAGVAGLMDRGGESPGHRADTEISSPQYRAAVKLDDSEKGGQAVLLDSSKKAVATGHSIDAERPDPASKQVFKAYLNGLGLSPKPHVGETIHITDGHIFGPELTKHPHNYPFSIYNTTNHPIDMAFTEYALRATRHWLNEASASENGVVIAGHTQVRVRPRAVPHAMIMADKMPAIVRDSTYQEVDGFTMWHKGLTKSFITSSGGPEAPFQQETIATEIAQSLIDTYDERAIPGELAREKQLQAYVGSFNPPGLHNLDLASQEYIANTLGDEISAAWEGGEAAVSKLPTDNVPEKGFPPKPLIDYAMFDPAVPAFLGIKRRILAEHSTIIAAKGVSLPTVDYYRQHPAS